MSSRRLVSFALTAFVVLIAADRSFGQAGSTLTPDRQSFMVNKDIGEERWTIALTLAQLDPPIVSSITGNVFRRDGSPPAFVVCQVRPDSTGSLSDPSSSFRLACKGTDACPSNARECARTSWRPLADDLTIAASFFLPPGGLDGSASVSAVAAAAMAPLPSRAASVDTAAQSSARGATLTFDGLSFLVNKDIAAERWSISINLVPSRTAEGGVVERVLNVTGNVFQADGSPPAFVYCLPTDDSTGTLDDPASQFQLACRGTDACATDAFGCAENEWRDLGPVSLAASFFLPPEGLPASPQSDSDLIVIGRTSDPPAIAARDFTVDASAAAEMARPAGQACAEGAACTVAEVGSCNSVTGAVLRLDDGSCVCLIEEIPAGCFTCGEGATGVCGESCTFPIGGATARGTCLPLSASSTDCVCFANDASGGSAKEGCASVLSADCPSARCCADDPRDGCNAGAGDYDCTGVCVIADCDGPSSCGICEPGAPAECGDGVATGNEGCDGSDFRGQSCASLGFAGGTLACDGSCDLVLSGCVDCGDEGASCEDDNDCCTGDCVGGTCEPGSEPTRTPAPTATSGPTATPAPTAVPTPSPELPCQPRAGRSCLSNGFGECCTSNLSCVFGQGNPPARICGVTSECGNEVVEVGEDCESSNDCNGVTNPFGPCVNCQCIPSNSECGNGIVEFGEDCERTDECDGPTGPCVLCQCVGGTSNVR
jgi:hypothetical protein